MRAFIGIYAPIVKLSGVSSQKGVGIMGEQLGRRQLISNLFYDYEKKMNQVLGTSPQESFEPSELFSPLFIESNPSGLNWQDIETGKRQSQIPERLSFWRNGARWIKISSLVSQPIDDFHSLVKVHWDSCYKSKEGREERVDFDVTYLLRRDCESQDYKIFCSINGDNLQPMKEKGPA